MRARPQHNKGPAAGTRRRRLLLQERQQAGLDERRLARTGAAHDRKKASTIEQAVYRCRVLEPSEEDRILIGPEGPQAGIGEQRRAAAMLIDFRPTKRARKARAPSGVMVSAGGRIRSRSLERKVSLRPSKGGARSNALARNGRSRPSVARLRASRTATTSQQSVAPPQQKGRHPTRAPLGEAPREVVGRSLEGTRICVNSVTR